MKVYSLIEHGVYLWPSLIRIWSTDHLGLSSTCGIVDFPRIPNTQPLRRELSDSCLVGCKFSFLLFLAQTGQGPMALERRIEYKVISIGCKLPRRVLWVWNVRSPSQVNPQVRRTWFTPYEVGEECHECPRLKGFSAHQIPILPSTMKCHKVNISVF
jgi:hypothetical protein